MAAPILLIGDGDLAEEVWRGLEALEADVVRLPHPTERELAAAFERGSVDRAVVVSRDDPFALRMALMVRDISDDTDLLVRSSTRPPRRRWRPSSSAARSRRWRTS